MRYFIKTYGCQMNDADSLWLEKIFEGLGWGKAGSLEEADIFLINSCSVRQAAEDKVYGLAPRVSAYRLTRPALRVILTGCMVGSATGERRRIRLTDLKKRLPWVDYFVPPGEIFAELPRILTKEKPLGFGGCGVLWGGAVRTAEDDAFVPVMRGCDHFCSYCVVPYGRGSERSRPVEEIVAEVTDLVKGGVAKITLLGQNVNSYGKGLADLDRWYNTLVYYHNGEGVGESRRSPFACLLRHLHKIGGLEEIWFLTSNPWDFNDDLIDALALPKVSKHLHLPVQSGDDEILKKMNRPYTVGEYKELVRRIRARVPEIELGTDLIVGFPGETAAQFQNTVALVKEIGFAGAFIALYSPREGTAAAKLYENDVPLAEKRRRHAVLTTAIEESRGLESSS